MVALRHSHLFYAPMLVDEVELLPFFTPDA